MDIETLEKVIEMLDARIETAQYEYLDAYTQFRDHLQKYVDKQVAHMETEQGM